MNVSDVTYFVSGWDVKSHLNQSVAWRTLLCAFHSDTCSRR